MRNRICLSAAVLALTATLCAGSATAAASAPRSQKLVMRIDLSKPFHLPGATFTATQGPDVPDVFYDWKAPGLIHLCVRVAASARCAPDLSRSLDAADPDIFKQVHFLDTAEVVYPRGRAAPPLLRLQVGSLHSGNGNQERVAVILAYRPAKRSFEVVFQDEFGLNNNQEGRYVASGPLKGSMIVVHSPFGPPFSYVVTVNQLTPEYRYKRVLRYRSATRYGDGNPLAVIDSEMPNILRRLGLWRPGQPFPLPQGRCPHPHLVKTELWCS